MLVEGMLWYDADKKKSLEQKITEAATHYREKYGQPPNVCAVHPSNGLPKKIGIIDIIPHQYTLPNHFWIGVSQAD